LGTFAFGATDDVAPFVAETVATASPLDPLVVSSVTDNRAARQQRSCGADPVVGGDHVGSLGDPRRNPGDIAVGPSGHVDQRRDTEFVQIGEHRRRHAGERAEANAIGV
jgi:hypothetical protein